MKKENNLVEKVLSVTQEMELQLDLALDRLNPWLDDPIGINDQNSLGNILSALKHTSKSVSERTLFQSLESWVEHYKNRHTSIGMVVTYNELGDKVELPSVIQNELVYVLQEACGNAVKHSNAGMIQILTVFQENLLKLTIADNGEGIDMERLNSEEKCGIGVTNMKERLKKLGGSIKFLNREQEAGSVVLLQVPLDDEKNQDVLSDNVLLANDLHDILCPEIIGVSMILENLKNSLTEDEAKKWYGIQCLVSQLQDIAKKLRSFSHQLLD